MRIKQLSEIKIGSKLPGGLKGYHTTVHMGDIYLGEYVCLLHPRKKRAILVNDIPDSKKVSYVCIDVVSTKDGVINTNSNLITAHCGVADYITDLIPLLTTSNITPQRNIRRVKSGCVYFDVNNTPQLVHCMSHNPRNTQVQYVTYSRLFSSKQNRKFLTVTSNQFKASHQELEGNEHAEVI